MIGKQIANYRIESKLGEGGMGVVYKATDLDLDRPVAIKVLSSEWSAEPELIERFRGEAKAQALLNHANIASLYCLLNVEGQLGIVMEFLEGETIEQIIRRRGLIPHEEAVPWFRQALLGVGFAHRQGLVHRDIKPSNIMVNRWGTVKVMDFGIAKMIGGRGLTRTGMSVGTVSYMSPEQVRNEGVDIRSDIYCLGVTLYEMLTAHLPFESASEFQVMSDHVNTPPPPLRQFYPYIPAGLEAAVLMAMAKKPEDRFQSVEAFGAALEHPGEVASGPAATVFYPSASGTGPAASAPARSETHLTGAQTPRPQSGPNAPQASGLSSEAAQNPPVKSARPAGVPPSTNKASSSRTFIYAGAAVAVVALTLGIYAMRPKAGAVASGQLGGGGQLEPATPPPVTPRPDTSAGTSSAQQTATPVNGAKSDAAADPNIMRALSAGQKQSSGGGLTGAGASGAGDGRSTDARVTGAVRGRDHTTRGQDVRSTPAPPSAPQENKPTPDQSATQPPVAPPSGPSDAELEGATEDLVKIKARMDAVHQSLATLKQEQASQGLGLRGDIASSESRLYSYYELADRALQQRNVTSAQRNMQQAETELEKLEHFLGR